MTKYHVPCECGMTVSVEVSKAGTTQTCFCGKAVQIPLMSALRRAAGQTPMPLNALEQFRLLIREGRLPDNVSCPITGEPVNDTVWLHVQCERVEVRDGRIKLWQHLLLALFTRVILVHRSGRPEVYGRDTAVEVPLGINRSARSSFMAARGQRFLKEALSCSPTYSQILREYPDAEVWLINDQDSGSSASDGSA
jgi:hypothetical protein